MRRKNGRAVRQWVAKNKAMIGEVRIAIAYDGCGILTFRMALGGETHHMWKDYNVLRQSLLRWRSLYDIPLVVNGESRGVISHKNEALKCR